MTKPFATIADRNDIVDARKALFEDETRIRATRSAGRQHVLMCAPEHFGVSYIINPWMQDQVGKAIHSLAHEQWTNLHRHLAKEAEIALIAPAPDLPDMVFSANAGFVIGSMAVVSRFRAKERRPEEPLFRAWFEQQGFEIAAWPEDVPFEGGGDALLDRAQEIVWCGYGMRSGAAAPVVIEHLFGRRTIGLRLVDERFYHLDTCFCPLAGGWLMYYPAAFDAASRAAIEAVVPEQKRIVLAEQDALHFACNAVDINGCVFMNHASEDLQAMLRAAGFTPVLTPLSEFMKAGGAAKCLTLKLVES